MGASVITFDTRCRDRFYNLAAEARIHCDAADAKRVDRLVEAVRLGYVTVRDARTTLAALRNTQRQAAA